MTLEKRIRNTEEGIVEKSEEINMGEADVKLTNLGSAIMTMVY